MTKIIELQQIELKYKSLEWRVEVEANCFFY